MERRYDSATHKAPPDRLEVRLRALALFAAARHPSAARAALRRGPARGGDPEHPHRLEPEAELLAPVGRGDVQPGQVAHPLEPVADRVAVREQPRGGVRDVPVTLQERLERLDQIRLVLVVVRDERLDRLGVEALELAGVLAHGREQAPVASKASTSATSASASSPAGRPSATLAASSASLPAR